MNTLRTLICILALACLGCSGGGMSKSQLQSAQSAMEKAIEAESAGRFSDALPLIESAVSTGGLNPDQLSEAYLIRSRCYSMTGKTDLAEKDLSSAEQGAPSPASFAFTKAILLLKQNKLAESKAEFNKAVKLDPKLKMPN
jgi:tetratricopeptide (TPR) repeat protein